MEGGPEEYNRRRFRAEGGPNRIKAFRFHGQNAEPIEFALWLPALAILRSRITEVKRVVVSNPENL